MSKNTMPGRNEPCPCGSGKKFKKCCANRPSDASAVAINRVNEIITLLDKGNSDAAIQVGLQALSVEPDNPELLELLGVAYYQTGQLDKAEAYFLKQTQLSQNNAQAHNNLAQVLLDIGDIENASLHCQYAIQLNKKFDAAYNLLGNIFRAANHLDEARDSYKKAVTLNQNNPLYLCNMGVVEQELGKYGDAEKHLAKALKLQPGFIPAMNLYAAALQAQHKYDKAIEIYERVLSIETDNTEAMNNLGVCYKDKGELDKAESLFQKVITARPGYVGAYINMGWLEVELGNVGKARPYFEKAITLAPDDSAARQGFGLILFKEGRVKEAEASYKLALEKNPHNGKAYAGLAEIFIGSQNFKKAKHFLDKALNYLPYDVYVQVVYAKYYEAIQDYESAKKQWNKISSLEGSGTRALLELASMYSSRGDYDKAEECYKKLAGYDDKRFYIKWSWMEERRHNLDKAAQLLNHCEDNIEGKISKQLLESVLARRNNQYEKALSIINAIDIEKIDNVAANARFSFEKGRILDKLKQYPEAMDSFKEGNRFRNISLGGNYSGDEHLLDFKKFFTRERQQQWTFDKYQGEHQPVFIVGFPRSGTTLLEQILSSHSQVKAGDELTYISNIASFVSEAILGDAMPYPERIKKVTQADVDRLREYYINTARTNRIFDEKKKYFTDKMPHNILHLGLINLLFPDAPIIHIMRHPLDSCLSAFMSNFGKGHFYLSTLENTAIHFANVMNLGEYYKDNLDLNIMTVRYEDLVSDQEANTHKILDFVGLDWEDSCLEFHKSKRVARTASYEQVTQKIYTSSRYRYKNYYEQLKPIFPILEQTIEHFGYTIEP